MKRHSFKKQSGRSMVEMLGVLAIIGVLSVGAIAGYNMAIEKHRLNEALEAVSLIITEVQIIFDGKESYAGLGTAITKDYAGQTVGDNDGVAAMVLERLKISTYYPMVIMGESNSVGITFNISVGNLSQSNCVKLYTMNWSEYGNDYGGMMGATGIVAEMSISEAQDFCEKMPGMIGFRNFTMFFAK